MRRRMAEQPRVVIAQVVLVAALVLGGAAVGKHLAVDGDEVPPATTKALERARSEAHAARLELGEARAERERLGLRAARERLQARALRRRNRVLRHSLERARRALARARRR